MQGIPGEYLFGGAIIVMGTMSFVCSGYDWYWKTFTHWSRRDSPLLRIITKAMSLAAIAAGIGVVSGLIKP